MFMLKNSGLLIIIASSLLFSTLTYANALADSQVFIKNIQQNTKPKNFKLNYQLKDPFFIESPSLVSQESTEASSNLSLKSKIFPIRYMNAKQLATLLNKKQFGLIEANESIYPLDNRNALIVNTTQNHLLRINKMILLLDKPNPQILIAARIVNIDNDYVKTLGMFFSSEQGKEQGGYNSNLNNRISIPIVKFRDNMLLNLHLDALEKEGHAQAISSPELLTLNHKTALIESGEEVPYQEKTGEGNTSVTFKNAVLRLKVTPELLAGQHILLQLEVNEDKVSDLVVNGVPAIRTQKLNTQVLVKNHQTFVLGGIFEEGFANQLEGVPGLRKLPLIGGLFRHHRRTRKRKQLLIFVTPTIVNN